MICKECGADNRESVATCANCGAELKKAAAERKKLSFLVAVGAVLILLSAVLITCLMSPKGYERDAKMFVKAVLKNDMQTVQELMVPAIYEYAGSSLNMGKSAKACRVRLESTEPMGSVPLLDYNELLVNLGSERKMTQAVCVSVRYRAELDGEKVEDTLTVIMGKIAEKWYVITIESP